MRWPRRIGASFFLVLLLAGPPLLLARTVGWPLRRWPSSQQARQWLEQPLTEQTLTGALAILAWLVWLLLAGTILGRLVVRTRAGMRWLRRVPLPTPLQATATGMAGAAVFSASASTTPAPQADIPSTTVGTVDHHPYRRDARYDVHHRPRRGHGAGWLDTARQRRTDCRGRSTRVAAAPARLPPG